MHLVQFVLLKDWKVGELQCSNYIGGLADNVVTRMGKEFPICSKQLCGWFEPELTCS